MFIIYITDKNEGVFQLATQRRYFGIHLLRKDEFGRVNTGIQIKMNKQAPVFISFHAN